MRQFVLVVMFLGLCAFVASFVPPQPTTFPPSPRCDIQMRRVTQEMRTDGASTWNVEVEHIDCYQRVSP